MPRGATPSRWCVCQFHHFGEVTLWKRGLKPATTSLLFRRRRRRRTLRLSRLPGRLLTGRLLLILLLLLLVLLLLLLLRAFTNHRRATRLRYQNRKRERRDHK